MTKSPKPRKLPGFTLMETVIAIGVLAVLVTAFLAVFGPAAQGIRRSINVQDADRLVATLEKEMSILRAGGSGGSGATTAFDKAFEWVLVAGDPTSQEMIMLYQYRGDSGTPPRDDGTLKPYSGLDGVAGQDYVVQSMARLRSDPLFVDDLEGLQGRVYGVRTQQLVFDGGELGPGTEGKIYGMNDGTQYTLPKDYPDAVIAFSAKFYALASNSKAFLETGGALQIDKLGKPIFTRNLGVRR